MGALIVVLLMDAMTCGFAFCEAWGFSEKGYPGIKKILGEKIEDHTIWKVQRFVMLALVVAVAVFAFKIKSDPKLVIFIATVVASWLAKFMALHQFSYNTTMYSLGVDGYSIGLKESPNTTSTKTKTWFRVFCLCVGIAIPILYIIYK